MKVIKNEYYDIILCTSTSAAILVKTFRTFNKAPSIETASFIVCEEIVLLSFVTPESMETKKAIRLLLSCLYDY